MSETRPLRYLSYVLVLLALFAFLGSNFERPAVVSIPVDKVSYIGGHVVFWDSSRNLLFLDGALADPASVLGVAGNRVVVRLRSIGPTFAAFPIFGTGKSFVTLDGGAPVYSSPVSARAGQTLRPGTDLSGLPSSGQVTVSWVLEVPGSSALTSSEVRPLPFSGRLASPTKTVLISGTYVLSTSIEISEFELGSNLYSAPDLAIYVQTSTAPAPTASSSNDTKPPLVSCTPSTFDPVPRTTPLLFKCTIYDASGIAAAYAKINGFTTTSQFLYDNSSGQWTYLVPASSYVTGETVGHFAVTSIDSSERANSATVDFPFLVQSDGKPSTSGNLNGSRISIPGAIDESLLNIKTPVPAVSPAPATPTPRPGPQVAISKGLAPLLKVLGIPLWVLLAILAVITYVVSGQRNKGKKVKQ